MTDNPLKDFNEVIIAFQDPNSDTKSTWYRQKSDNNNSDSNGNNNSTKSLCLQCNSPRKNTNFYPFCGAICKGAWNAAREDDVKRNFKKNPLLEFSEVLGSK
jgi:hypothetical protein